MPLVSFDALRLSCCLVYGCVVCFVFFVVCCCYVLCWYGVAFVLCMYLFVQLDEFGCCICVSAVCYVWFVLECCFVLLCVVVVCVCVFVSVLLCVVVFCFVLFCCVLFCFVLWLFIAWRCAALRCVASCRVVFGFIACVGCVGLCGGVSLRVVAFRIVSFLLCVLDFVVGACVALCVVRL